jgi:hypothetical protein
MIPSQSIELTGKPPELRDMAMRRIFWGFCINRFGIGPLHYVSSRSDVGFKFAEIFVIKNQSPTHQVGESKRLPIDIIFFKHLNKSMVIVHYPESGSRRLYDSPSFLLNIQKPTLQFGESGSRRLEESATPRLGESESRRVRESVSRFSITNISAN